MGSNAGRAEQPAPRSRAPWTGDDGSIIPLVLGFCLLALLLIAGAVATSDVFTKQRSLQSVCDGAAIYAANNVAPGALHGGGAVGSALPLTDATAQVATYLTRDAGRAGVQPTVAIGADGVTVEVTCQEHSQVAFGFVILHASGVDQVAHSSARSRIVR
jgi:uncharacterized membrane protein